MKSLQQLGTDLGRLLEEKTAAYGSSFAASGDFLRLLFPGGVPADRYDDALLMVRIFDKQMRIATDKDAFGESPYQDIAGYGILGVQLHQQRKDSTTWQGSASGLNVNQSSKGQPDSAAPFTERPTTPSAAAISASVPLQQPASYSAPQKAANASTAMEAVSASVDARVKEARRNNLAHTYERWLYRHNNLNCIGCEVSVSNLYKRTVPVKTGLGVIKLHTCLDCHEFCLDLLLSGQVKGAGTP